MATTQGDAPAALAAAFLEGGGELGALMRAYDWAKTPLGPPAGWPRSLKTAVRLMLTSRQPIWLGWGPELTYLYNDPYKSIIGGKHPQALGRPFAEVWREIWDVVGPMAERVTGHDEGIYVEAQMLIMERHGYQEETYYTYSYSPIPDDDGRTAGLFCANTDDTRRVIGERQLALLSELSARTGQARSLSDVPHLAMGAFGTNAKDLPFVLIFTPDAQGKLALAASSPGTGTLADPLLWPRDGGIHVLPIDAAKGSLPKGPWPRQPANVAVLPVAAAGKTERSGLLVVGLNPFRQFDEGYRGFLDLVAQQLAAVIANAQAYEDERRRAEALAELDQAKTVFFSNVSHELRTPLTLMLGPLEDLLGKAEPALAAEDREPLLIAQRNGLRLLKLVNTLLDFARIEAGRTQASFEPTDVSAFSADLASNFRAACERAGLRLTVDCPEGIESVNVDREMWEKVILNLLSNAFKFTLEGGITLRARDAGNDIEVSVSDTGIGMAESVLPRIFERFHRVEGAGGRSHEGTGIGLALVNELVKLHGGSIGVSSNPGKGTTFTILLPKGTAHLPAGQVRSQGQERAAGMRAETYVEEVLSWLPAFEADAAGGREGAPRVLLADDNADLREYARRLLVSRYRVEAVADGEAALAAARAQRPDIIVSDVMMPKLDGFGLLRELRADPALRTIPVILVSARAGEEARIEGLGKGADDYLVKPFSSRELMVRVATLLQSAEIRRQSEDAIRARTEQFETLLNQAPIGVYLVDDDLRIAAVNPVAAPAFGDIPDLVGRDFGEVMRILWPKPHADKVVGLFRDVLSTGEPHVDLEHMEQRRDRGVAEYYESRLYRLPLPGGRFGVVCYFRDISKAVLTREALREADRRKDEFIATLSHELRNPLAPLRNALQLMRLTGQAEGSFAPVHEMMERQVNSLVRLVDDLLEISRISRGTFELRKQRVEVSSIVRNAVETSQPLIEAAGHKLELKLPEASMWVEGDPFRLSQVLSNMLNNSAKYTDPGGRIEVEVERAGAHAAISVRDNGSGIAPASLPFVFDMFTRGERSSARSQDGLGIGLALAKRLTEMHGGTITARSDGPGKGSKFKVRLPLAQVQQPGPSLVDGQAAGITRRRILIVDDNRDAAQSLALILEALGAEVRTAHNGAEALEAFPKFEPAVVLLDIGMPGMDGYEVARRMRSAYPGRATLVALTGWGQEDDRRKAREAGFDHHITKPAEIGALQALLASLEAERPSA